MKLQKFIAGFVLFIALSGAHRSSAPPAGHDVNTLATEYMRASMTLLENGTVTLPMLRANIERWIGSSGS